MSHDSYVYGMIKADIQPLPENNLAIQKKNLEAIAGLPDTENDWPMLSKQMFSYTSLPLYRDHIYHFGAAYKDILGGWRDFEAKLDELLGRMDWSKVDFIVEDIFAGHFHAQYTREVRDGIYGPTWKKEVYSIGNNTGPLIDLGQL